MKQILLLIFVIVNTNLLKAQIPSNCYTPIILQTNYDEDVKSLALNRILLQNSIYKDSIIIPFSYQDTIWQGLSSIFNLTTIMERDSVFDNYCIHIYGNNKIYHYISVNVDTSYSWTHQWQNLNTITGLTSLDNLLSLYGFTIYSYYAHFNYATLITTQNINVIPLCEIINTFNGVFFAEPQPMNIGDGNRITYNKMGNDRFYDFTVGYGDCPSGCTGEHTFKFKVYEDCSVDYLGVTNIFDPMGLPNLTNCNITTKINNLELENFKVYPNPSNEYVNIETNYLQNISYKLINIVTVHEEIFRHMQ